MNNVTVDFLNKDRFASSEIVGRFEPPDNIWDNSGISEPAILYNTGRYKYFDCINFGQMKFCLMI